MTLRTGAPALMILALGCAAPPGAVLGQGTLAVGEASTTFPVQPGSYYLVVENQQAAPFAPLGLPLPVPEQTTYLTYSLEVGDR